MLFCCQMSFHDLRGNSDCFRACLSECQGYSSEAGGFGAVMFVVEARLCLACLLQ